MNTDKKGKLIVIEGIDGSGKGTQLKRLQVRLESEGIKTETFSFPQYETFMGRYIGKMLTGEYGKLANLNPHIIAPMYALNRYELKDRILKALDEGKWLILDRYIPSNMHQASKERGWKKREEVWNYFETLEYDLLGMPHEDIVVFLNISPDAARKLIRMKEKRAYTGNRKKDIAENSLAHQKAAAETYKHVAKQRKHWVIINCNHGKLLKSSEDISNEIYGSIKKLIKL